MLKDYQIQIGDTLTRSFTFSQDEVVAFAQVTGDNNPLHLDPAFASKTVFKRPIIHGILCGSVFTKFLTNAFPENSFIYMKQTFEFLRPMFVDTHYEVTFCVQHIDIKRQIAEILGEIKNLQTNKIALRGVATLMVKSLSV